LQDVCLDVSKELKQELINNGYDAVVVQGKFEIDYPNEQHYNELDVDDFENEEYMGKEMYTPLHYWVEVDGIIVDITADQFNDELNGNMPSVVIGNYDDLVRYIPVHKDWK